MPPVTFAGGWSRSETGRGRKVFKCVGLAAEREGSRLLRPEGKGTEEVVAARHRCVLVAVVMEEDGGKKSDQRWSKRIKRSQSSGKISQPEPRHLPTVPNSLHVARLEMAKLAARSGLGPVKPSPFWAWSTRHG